MKIERKLIESEQLRTASTSANPNNITSTVPTSSSNSTIKNEDDLKSETICDPLNAMNPNELFIKDADLICENNVLIEMCKLPFFSLIIYAFNLIYYNKN